MNNRKVAQGCLISWVNRMLLLAGLAISQPPASAQIVTTLIEFTNNWKYNQAGEDLGTNWVSVDFDDTGPSWQTGRALFAVETIPLPGNYNLATVVPNVPPTVLSLTSAGGTNGTNVTFYFRTGFFNPHTNLVRVQLWATNLVDDGCVLYLNGGEVGRLRVPTNQTYLTYASAGPASEGALEPRNLGTARLLPGSNVFAAEVHQMGPVPFVLTDIAWAMRLVALESTPLVITNQPQSQIVSVGDSVVLQVGVSGTPAFYRWEKDGVLQSSTSDSLRIANAQLANTGNYRVIITNSISAVTSSVATLTVVADLTGPKLLAAIINNRPLGGSPFGPDTINVFYDEPLPTNLLTTHPNSGRNTNNYCLVSATNPNIQIAIQGALYSMALGVLLIVDANDPNWTPEGEYILIVNNLIDRHGNVIAPDSRIAVARRALTNLVSTHAVWSVHASYSSDPSVYDQPWQTPNFVESSFWISGAAPFCGGALPSPPCVADCETPVPYQLSPTLLRTTFVWPESLPANTGFFLNGAVDDGLVLFLNGVEIWRTNAVGNRVPVTLTNYAAVGRSAPLCFSNVAVAVTNLVPGTNLLAAAVVQALTPTEFDSAFTLSVEGEIFPAPILPEEHPPTLRITPLGAESARLSWTGHGYALESATNLNLGSLSYPIGPWQQVSNVSNPFTNALSEPARFFRLKK